MGRVCFRNRRSELMSVLIALAMAFTSPHFIHSAIIGLEWIMALRNLKTFVAPAAIIEVKAAGGQKTS